MSVQAQVVVALVAVVGSIGLLLLGVAAILRANARRREAEAEAEIARIHARRPRRSPTFRWFEAALPIVVGLVGGLAVLWRRERLRSRPTTERRGAHSWARLLGRLQDSHEFDTWLRDVFRAGRKPADQGQDDEV